MAAKHRVHSASVSTITCRAIAIALLLAPGLAAAITAPTASRLENSRPGFSANLNCASEAREPAADGLHWRNRLRLRIFTADSGIQFDDETGLVYARARYYDPVLGRFLSRDTIEGSLIDAPSLHRYAYARENPLRHTDFSGNFDAELEARLRELQADPAAREQIPSSDEAIATAEAHLAERRVMATRVGTPQHDEAIADETAALRRADDARSMRVFHATVGLPVVLGAGAIAAAPGAAAAASTGLGGALLTNGTIAVVGLSQTSTQPTAALVYGPPAQGVRCVTRTGSQADVVGACISTGTAVVTLGIGAGAGASARLGAMTDALASESAAAGSQGLVEGVGELGGLRPTIPAGSPAMCVETASGSIALIAAGDQPASTGFTVSVPATKSGGMEEFVTLYHGTSSNRAAKIVGSEYYDAQGFRPSPKDDAVFFAEDYDTAEHFAFQSEYPRGGTPPQSFTVMELKIPKSLAQRVGLLKSTPIGEFREAPFIQPGTSPYERVLVGDDVGDFNQALLNGDIKVRRLKVGGQ